VGLKAVVDAVVKRKIPSPRRASNPRTPIVQPVALLRAWTKLNSKRVCPTIFDHRMSRKSKANPTLACLYVLISTAIFNVLLLVSKLEQ